MLHRSDSHPHSPTPLLVFALLAFCFSASAWGQAPPKQEPKEQPRSIKELDAELKRQATVDEINGIRSQLGSGVESSLSELMDPKLLKREFGNALRDLALEEQRQKEQERDNLLPIRRPKNSDSPSGRGWPPVVAPGQAIVLVRVNPDDMVSGLLSIGDYVQVSSERREFMENKPVRKLVTLCRAAKVVSLPNRDRPNQFGLSVPKEHAAAINRAQKTGKVKLLITDKPAPRDRQLIDRPATDRSRPSPPQVRREVASDHRVRSDAPVQRVRQRGLQRDAHAEPHGDRHRVQDHVHPQPRKDPQARVLREIARRLEELAAELEEAGLHGEADGLRDQARDFWHRAR